MRADEIEDQFIARVAETHDPAALEVEVVVVMPDDGSRYAVSGARFNTAGELEILIA